MSLTKTIVAVTLLALLVYTNPTMDDFGEYMRKEIVQDLPKEDSLGKVIGSLLGGFASHVITNATIRRDFVIFSLYETDLGNKDATVIGVLNNFIVLNPEEFKKNLMESLELE